MFCGSGHLAPLLDIQPQQGFASIRKETYTLILQLEDNLSSTPANKLPINVYENQFENSNAPHKYRSSNEYFYLITRMLLRYCLIHNPLYINGEIKVK